MRTFDSNVDGYYDVEPQLTNYLHGLADDYFEAERAKKSNIDSIESANEHAREMRDNFVDSIGGLPSEKTPLNSHCSGTLEREEYAIEKVIFESLPGFHVTANCYRPTDGNAPYPAVVFFLGHAGEGKAYPLYQRFCIDLVRNGFVVLSLDSIGHGERVQGLDSASGEPERSGTAEHTYLGQQCTVAGNSLARYMVWDGIRSVDYLLTRQDVDPDRIGAFGNSGGGMHVTYQMLCDDRIAVAGAGSHVCSREEYMKTGQAQDADQIVYGTIARGPNFDDFISAMAPKPVQIAAAQSGFFPIEGALKTYERASNVYALYDRESHVDINVSEDIHGLTAPLREGAVNWFIEHLQGRTAAFEIDDPAVAAPEDLRCTDSGQVHVEYADETHVVDLNRAWIDARFDEPGTVPRVDDTGTYRRRLRDEIVDAMDLDRPTTERHPRSISIEFDDGLAFEKVFFFSEQDVLLTGVLVFSEDAEPAPSVVGRRDFPRSGIHEPIPREGAVPLGSRPTIALLKNGTDELPTRREWLADLVDDRGLVLVLDTRGVGAVQSHEINTPLCNGNEYYDMHGTEYTQASYAMMMGTSLYAMRIFDVLRGYEYLADRLNADGGIGLVGREIGALHAMTAAVVEPGFESIRLEDVPPSFHDVATSYEYDIDHRRNVYGVVGRFDVPQLRPALSDRDVEWIGDASVDDRSRS